MSIAAALLVAALHVGFMVLESILWTKPMGRKIFKLSQEKAEVTKDLASNQGVYNLMLAVGIVWAVTVGNAGALSFLLAFIVTVGVYGAATVSPAILVVQSGPALLALVLQQLNL